MKKEMETERLIKVIRHHVIVLISVKYNTVQYAGWTVPQENRDTENNRCESARL